MQFIRTYSCISLDCHLIVYVYNSITENISGHNLYDIFHELLSRKIQHFPFTKILLSILDWIGLKD